MRRATRWSAVLACPICAIPAAAEAHTFPTPYVLPVPFWMYIYGCAATLIVTCAVLAYFWGAPTHVGRPREWDVAAGPRLRDVARWGLTLIRMAALACLLATIVGGFVGTLDPQRNISMVLFWVVFLLGFTYVTVLVGDVFALINPWRTIVDGVQRLGVDLERPRWRDMPRIGYWPAFAFYVALIWLELFALPRPFILSLVLVIYTGITVIGAALLGSSQWFHRCDVFSVFFSVVATLAPVVYRRGQVEGSYRVQLRWPFVGGITEAAEHVSIVVFVLFMLSSTTYDAIHQTQLWVELYWRPLVWFLESFQAMDLGSIQKALVGWYLVYQRAGLLLSLLIYFAAYRAVLWCVKTGTNTPRTLSELARTFGYSLVPIGVAYHFTHYFPLLLLQMKSLPALLTDPLGVGWTLLNLGPTTDPPPPQMAIVWHVQVGVLLLGHLVGVCQSHAIAMRMFETRRQVVISQLPLLVLMVGYTATGLWVLSLPLSP